jgi:predicted ribosomally synthesized peptide with SipW-like signal peptide
MQKQQKPKKNRKKLILAILALLSIAVLVIGGTLAYLTDTAYQTNTFAISSVDVQVAEWDYIGNEGWTTDGEDYLENYEPGASLIIVPGATYKKDPVVYNVGIEDGYVRATVTIPVVEIGDNNYQFAYMPSFFKASANSAYPSFVALQSGSASFEGGTPSYTVKVPSNWQLSNRGIDISDGYAKFVFTYKNVLEGWDQKGELLIKKDYDDYEVSVTSALFEEILVNPNLNLAYSFGEDNDAQVWNGGEEGFGKEWYNLLANGSIKIFAEIIQSNIDGVTSAAAAFAKVEGTVVGDDETRYISEDAASSSNIARENEAAISDALSPEANSPEAAALQRSLASFMTDNSLEEDDIISNLNDYLGDDSPLGTVVSAVKGSGENSNKLDVVTSKGVIGTITVTSDGETEPTYSASSEVKADLTAEVAKNLANIKAAAAWLDENKSDVKSVLDGIDSAITDALGTVSTATYNDNVITITTSGTPGYTVTVNTTSGAVTVAETAGA